MKRKIETKFNLGDSVFAIGYETKRTTRECEFCIDGTIPLTHTGSSYVTRFTCPACHGKQNMIAEWEEWQVVYYEIIHACVSRSCARPSFAPRKSPGWSRAS